MQNEESKIMEKILKDLEAAMAAEKIQTPALTVAKSLFTSLRDRLTEHVATAPAAPAAPIPVPK